MKVLLRKTTTPALAVFLAALVGAAPAFGGELYCDERGNRDAARCVQPQTENAVLDKIYFTLKVVVGRAEEADMLEQTLALEKIGDVPLPGNRRVMFHGRFSDDAQAFQALDACMKQDAEKCASLAPEVVRIDINGHDAEADDELRNRSLSMLSGVPQQTVALNSTEASTPDATSARPDTNVQVQEPTPALDQSVAVDTAEVEASPDQVAQASVQRESETQGAVDVSAQDASAQSAAAGEQPVQVAQVTPADQEPPSENAETVATPASDESVDQVTATPAEVTARQSTESRTPTGLYRLPASVDAVVWADLGQGKLHLVERSGERFYATLSMPISTDESAGEKLPLGVYRLMKRIRDIQLHDFYGSGAYTLNFPNAVDDLRSRSGPGLWLHGSARNGARRPSRYNDRNLAISNESLQGLGDFIDLQTTPIVLSHGIEWSDVDTVAAQGSGLEQAIEAWRTAWSALDNDKYLSFYGRDFSSKDKGLAEWKRYKTRIHRRKSFIDVQISDLSLIAYPGEDGAVLARFRQQYKSSNYNADGWKEQLWRRNADGEWKIVFEGG